MPWPRSTPWPTPEPGARRRRDPGDPARRPGPRAAAGRPLRPAAAGAQGTAARPRRRRPLLVARESLRLRARWLQELTARAAWEIGRRLAETGELASPDAVRHLTLDQLDEVARRRRPAATSSGRCAGGVARAAPGPVPARRRWRGRAGGQPRAQGGRPRRRWRTGQRSRPSRRRHAGRLGAGRPHAVARPRAVLPRLRGLVAETGSVLSHLAILARESECPVVVGASDAIARYPEGTIVSVDGATGDVVSCRPWKERRHERPHHRSLDSGAHPRGRRASPCSGSSPTGSGTRPCGGHVHPHRRGRPGHVAHPRPPGEDALVGRGAQHGRARGALTARLGEDAEHATTSPRCAYRLGSACSCRCDGRRCSCGPGLARRARVVPEQRAHRRPAAGPSHRTRAPRGRSARAASGPARPSRPGAMLAPRPRART